MFGSKAKQLEEALRANEAEVAELTARNEDLSGQLAGYHAKEEAIIGALTEAKSAAARIVAAAEKVRNDTIEEAEQNKRLAAKEAERVIEEAHAHAEEIRLDARQKADELLVGVENDAKMYRETLAAFNAQLFAAADHVKAYAENFEALARGEVLSDDSTEIDYGTAAIRKSLEQKNVELPEEYETPAALMQGIYALQGRNLPRMGTEEGEAGEEYQGKPEMASEESELTVLEPESPSEKPEEEHVWTVDEIISDAMAKAESDIAVDAQLNALIDDVLKG
jgi:cell division septum initiation protein DivIVA